MKPWTLPGATALVAGAPLAAAASPTYTPLLVPQVKPPATVVHTLPTEAAPPRPGTVRVVPGSPSAVYLQFQRVLHASRNPHAMLPYLSYWRRLELERAVGLAR